jgi:protein-S-isoprenylcysteine O-methyltransferase Ste14
LRPIPRIVVIIGCVVVAAAAVALTAAWRTGQHATMPPKASCGSATTHRVGGDTQILAAEPAR